MPSWLPLVVGGMMWWLGGGLNYLWGLFKFNFDASVAGIGGFGVGVVGQNAVGEICCAGAGFFIDLRLLTMGDALAALATVLLDVLLAEQCAVLERDCSEVIVELYSVLLSRSVIGSVTEQAKNLSKSFSSNMFCHTKG